MREEEFHVCEAPDLPIAMTRVQFLREEPQFCTAADFGCLKWQEDDRNKLVRYLRDELDNAIRGKIPGDQKVPYMDPTRDELDRIVTLLEKDVG